MQSVAAISLGELKGTTAVSKLIRNALNTQIDVRPRYFAAEALGKIGDLDAFDPLIKLLKDRSSEVRRRAAPALGRLGDQSAIEPLVEMVRHEENGQVKTEAIKALRQLGFNVSTLL